MILKSVVLAWISSPYLNAGCQYALDLDGAVDKPNGIAQTDSILIRTSGLDEYAVPSDYVAVSVFSTA